MKRRNKNDESKDDNKVLNFYDIIPKDLLPKSNNPNFQHHMIKLPARILVVGGSGSMKTNLICDMIRRMNNTFGNIKIISKMEEPLYNFLKMKIPASHLQVSEGIESVPNVDYFDEDEEMKDLQHLVIFDDLVLEDPKLQKKLICPYFVRGRKCAKGISSVYITQSYYETPATIRKNLTHIFLKKLSNNRDLANILREYNLGLSKEELFDLYNTATADEESFLMVDVSAPQNKKFRKNYLDIVNLNNSNI